jgi:hypothetical protein
MTKPQNAPSPGRAFCGTVRRAGGIKRTGDSLAGKTRVAVPPPPKNPLLLSLTNVDSDDNNEGAAERREENRADVDRKEKNRERAAFLRVLPPTKKSLEMPLVIPKNVGLRPTTPQLDVVLGSSKKKPLVIRVVMTEEPDSPKWRF